MIKLKDDEIKHLKNVPSRDDQNKKEIILKIQKLE